MSDRRVHRLGEVLREAREAKGVDLGRVERETKIRERYLSALERGEYRELPGAVYTKGFLRNYGAYLGLDPEELIDLYRLETTATPERPRVPTPPRPLAARRSRAFVVTPGAIMAAILTIGVGAFIAYLAFELINFARMPDLRITEPPGDVNGWTQDEITIRGITAPNATVTVTNLRENPVVTADATGAFEVSVGLVPGSNVVGITAHDPVTNRDSPTERRRIVVVTETAESPSPGAAALTVDEPAADATLTGPVPVRGSASPGAEIVVQAQLVEPAALNVEVADAGGAPVDLEPDPPSPPEPTTLTAAESGAFEGTLTLAPGTWQLDIAADGGEPEVRSVTVTAGEGLAAIVRVDGADSYLELEEDGTAVEGWPGIASDGDRIELSGSDELRIRVGNAGAVRLTINGINIGVMGEDAQVVDWRIRPAGD